jgi:hypothetical protein
MMVTDSNVSWNCSRYPLEGSLIGNRGYFAVNGLNVDGYWYLKTSHLSTINSLNAYYGASRVIFPVSIFSDKL